MDTKTKAKLNALLFIYTVGAFVFQPLASAIQGGVLFYLARAKEYKHCLIGGVLFVCSVVIEILFYKNDALKYDQLYLIALVVIVFANLFWFVIAIKKIKLNLFFSQSQSVNES